MLVVEADGAYAIPDARAVRQAEPRRIGVAVAVIAEA
jgi:hypothetical protein